MKLRIMSLIALLALFTGCTKIRQHMGAAADTDQNVMTGGPITGTTIQDLPDAVKATLQQKAGDAEITDIDKTTRDSKEVYEITFAERGKNGKLLVAQDGSVVTNGKAN